MNVEVPMPQLGETVAEGTITRWLRRVGDVVSAQEPLLEISTDKVDTEVPAPSGGTLLEIRVPEDATVSVGTVLALIGPSGEGNDAGTPPPSGSAPATAEPATAAPATAEPATAAPAEPDRVARSHRVPRHVHSPRVRRLAAEAGVALTELRGSGPQGRVTPADVAAAAERDAAAVQGARSGLAARSPAGPAAAVVEVDVTAVIEPAGEPLTLTASIAKAAFEALRITPALTPAGAGRQHLGVAVDTEHGTLVAVVRDAGDLNLPALARRIGELVGRARSGAAVSDDLAAVAFAIADTDGRQALFSTTSLPPGLAAVLTPGAVVERPAVLRLPGGERVIAIRSTVHLALTHDPQLVPAADADRLLGAIKERLESARFEDGSG